MKKAYQKPCMICEDLQPETMLCGCDMTNPIYSDLEMCGYPIQAPGTDTTFVLFSSGWDACNVDNDNLAGTELHMCWGAATTSIFGS